MDELLISLVEKNEELYNTRHPHYSNIQIKDNIWEQIGSMMGYESTACRERWSRVRENFRKALNLRKVKHSSKLKEPKYSKELSFLLPFMNDEDIRRLNVFESDTDDGNKLRSILEDNSALAWDQAQEVKSWDGPANSWDCPDKSGTVASPNSDSNRKNLFEHKPFKKSTPLDLMAQKRNATSIRLMEKIIQTLDEEMAQEKEDRVKSSEECFADFVSQELKKLQPDVAGNCHTIITALFGAAHADRINLNTTMEIIKVLHSNK